MIKGTCFESGGNTARFHIRGELPKCGIDYVFEEWEEGSNRQTRLVRSLVECFFKYMFDTNTFITEDCGNYYDLSAPNKNKLYDLLKRDYGLGFERIKYCDNDYSIKEVSIKTPRGWKKSNPNKEYNPWLEIPEYVRDDFKINKNYHRIEGILISWTHYNKHQRKDFIDTVFKLMYIYGVDNYKFNQIKKGLEDIQKKQDEKERLKNAVRKSNN